MGERWLIIFQHSTPCGNARLSLCELRLPRPDVIVVDEVHMKLKENVRSIIANFPDVFVVGLTSTLDEQTTALNITRSIDVVKSSVINVEQRSSDILLAQSFQQPPSKWNAWR